MCAQTSRRRSRGRTCRCQDVSTGRVASVAAAGRRAPPWTSSRLWLAIIGSSRELSMCRTSKPVASQLGLGVMKTDYVRDGIAIYRESFATIRAEADLNRFPADVSQV